MAWPFCPPSHFPPTSSISSLGISSTRGGGRGGVSELYSLPGQILRQFFGIQSLLPPPSPLPVSVFPYCGVRERGKRFNWLMSWESDANSSSTSSASCEILLGTFFDGIFSMPEQQGRRSRPARGGIHSNSRMSSLGCLVCLGGVPDWSTGGGCPVCKLQL